ncbi:MAG: hypothetical protein H6704_11725 [Myxococcales bacterium]|nr:hypothetical protein [Myxococcales bacterium]MCB9536913.1 hypothetical protein [Myxococcales bacterium]
MSVRAWLITGLAVATLGCGDDPPKSRPKAPEKAGAEKPADSKAAKGTDAKAGEAAKGAAGAEGAAPPAYTWTETPTFEGIPAAPAGGMVNGKPFPVVTVLVEPGLKGWKIAFHDQPLKRPTGLIVGSHHLDLHLQGDTPAVGSKYEKKMTFGGGYWQVPKPGDDSGGATSWNASNAYVLEFTQWDVKPYDPEGPVFQEGGTASGRVAVNYKGSGDFQNSWLAGTFENATVRYMGKPYWVKQAEKAAPGDAGAPAADAGKKADAPK